MSRTVRGLFRRLHDAGLLLDEDPGDYEFYSHRLRSCDREAGAMRWSMFRKDCRGQTVTSMYPVKDCISGPVKECKFLGVIQGSEIEIQPDE